MTKNINFKKISIHKTPEQSPGFLLWHISTLWRGFIEASLKTLNLTHPQFVVLATLGWLTRNGDKVSQTAIGKMAALDPNTTSQIIKGLEQKGLIKRITSADARAKNPILTTNGSKILTQAMPLVEDTDGQFFQNLNKQQQKELIKLFLQLIAQE